MKIQIVSLETNNKKLFLVGKNEKKKFLIKTTKFYMRKYFYTIFHSNIS